MKTLYSDLYQSLINRLREVRLEADMTQTQLSERLGKPQSYVSKVERGERRLDVIEYLEMCRQIGVDPYVMLREIDPQR